MQIIRLKLVIRKCTLSSYFLQPFFSVNSEADWPLISCDAEHGPGGDTKVRSLEGRATLTLSASGEDFSVEFLCSISQPDPGRNAHSTVPATGPTSQQRGLTPKSEPSFRTDQRVGLQNISGHVDKPKDMTRMKLSRPRSCSPQGNSSSPSLPKVEHALTVTPVIVVVNQLCPHHDFLPASRPNLTPCSHPSQRTCTCVPRWWSSITPAPVLPPCGGTLSLSLATTGPRAAGRLPDITGRARRTS